MGDEEDAFYGRRVCRAIIGFVRFIRRTVHHQEGGGIHEKMQCFHFDDCISNGNVIHLG
jgi:hypothetical protein